MLRVPSPKPLDNQLGYQKIREVKPMKELVVFRINGESYEIYVEPKKTLLEVLREDLGLTGTKEVCDLGTCGACTVLIENKPLLSCLTLAVACKGKEIITIEEFSA